MKRILFLFIGVLFFGSLYSQSEGEVRLNKDVLRRAIEGYKREESVGDLLAIVDFSLPSTEKRFWILNVMTGEVVYNTYISHGRNSGLLYATRFSNELGSRCSSPGFYKTAETYMGKHGYSLRLDGLEKGINDNARARAIVLHGADYATERFLSRSGYLGRSFGCPSVPSDQVEEIIDLLKGGTLLYIHTNDKSYLVRSEVVKNMKDVSVL